MDDACLKVLSRNSVFSAIVPLKWKGHQTAMIIRNVSWTSNFFLSTNSQEVSKKYAATKRLFTFHPPTPPCVGGPGKLFTDRTGNSELLSWATEAVQHTKKPLIKGELNQTHKLARKQKMYEASLSFLHWFFFFFSIFIQRKISVCASNMSSLRCSHVGSVFTSEQQKKVGLWYLWYLWHTWQHLLSSFCALQMPIFNKPGKKLSEKLLCVYFLFHPYW